LEKKHTSLVHAWADHDIPLSAGEVDDQSNYVVLCPNDHTRIDKQPGFYTESKLREIRADHERWAQGRLIERRIPPMRIRDAQPGRPVPLYPATKGADVVGVVGGSHALLIAGKPDDLIEGEVELVGDFLQVLTDWMDIWDEIGPAHQLEVEYSMTKTLQELGDAGFGVLVGSRYQILEGGIGRPSNWRTAVVSVYRIKDQQ
jgi:hypothetical protein